MTPNPTRKALLYLEDGTVLEGQAIGWEGTTSGEICFTTGMTGYQEIFTDPSYFQQILVMTNVHIGNYGVRNLESESDKVQISGLVIRNFSPNFSRNRADMDLDSFLKQHQIVGIAGIDTRLLVRDIRTKGAMNALISTDGTTVEELGRMMSGIPSMEGLELSSQVTTDEVYYLGDPEAEYRVSVHLRFRQWVGAFGFDWILGSQDQERDGDFEGLAPDGHLPLLHFEQCALHLGGRTVDFIRKQKVGKDRTERGVEFARLLIVDARAERIPSAALKSSGLIPALRSFNNPLNLLK